MGYCTVTEVKSMIKDDAMNAIIGDEYIEDATQREAKITALIEEAITDATSEIDGYLAKRYSVPLSSIPSVINKFSKDIAVYNLFSRMGIDEDSREKNYLNRYNAATKFLVLLAEGKVDIGITDTTTAAKSGFSISSNPRLFTRNSMRGM